jgi:hypothetical protein
MAIALPLPFPWWILLIIAVWQIPWKGFAMWKAARRKHLVWFVVFLIVNLLAVPEIIYLVITRKTKDKK